MHLTQLLLIPASESPGIMQKKKQPRNHQVIPSRP